ncbi:hypothetical protein G9464_18120 [Halostella sp. JP-L12]|uniref:hypothetical protein n=1 Tax=Halostella TaxID=1843185 RepID=UPI0013CED365|nr:MULTISPECIES: hypothetical protein [Halostella]NHN49490.1 hypothetical protein [Halostella sp. JP-L12]
MPAADGAGSVAHRGTERRVDLYLRDGVPTAIAGRVESTIDRGKATAAVGRR